MWLRRSVSAFGLALMAVTWRLWTPEHGFPQVPFFYAAQRLPAWVQWIDAAGMTLGLVGGLTWPWAGRVPSAVLLTFAASACGLILLDQERLQPWAYQFILVALVLALTDARRAIGLLRLLIISFYFHSAVTKLDYSFLHGLGQQFLASLAGALGASIDGWSEAWRVAAAAVFPGVELLIAVGLWFARTRRVALIGAVTLHLLLLVILGPWGLNHKPGVLIWNVYFIVQDVLLFWSAARAAPATAEGREEERLFGPGAGNRVAQVITLAAMGLPFLAPNTGFDLWPSWGLYASSAEGITLFVHRLAVDDLPPELRQFVERPESPDDPWAVLRLDRWSLDALGAPIYPQNRYQLGVAEAVIVRYQLANRFRLIRFEMAHRWCGERNVRAVVGVSQLEEGANDYFFNSRPNQASFRP